MKLFPLITKEFDGAKAHLNDAIHALDQLSKIHSTSARPPTDKNSLPGEETIQEEGAQFDSREFQLLLEYRLSSHEALQALFQYQKQLCELLGIGSLTSEEVVYERLAYALGSDDLHAVLLTLTQLSDALLKVLGRMEAKNEIRKRELTKSQKEYTKRRDRQNPKAYTLLKTAITHQAAFIVAIKRLAEGLEATYEGTPEYAEVMDHYVAIKGYIIKLHAALQKSFILSGALYQQALSKTPLKPELNEILHQVHHALQLTTPALESQSFFSHHKSHQVGGHDLEERAAAIRLSNFFHK